MFFLNGAENDDVATDPDTTGASAGDPVHVPLEDVVLRRVGHSSIGARYRGTPVGVEVLSFDDTKADHAVKFCSDIVLELH